MAVRYNLIGERRRPVFGGNASQDEGRKKKSKKKISMATAVKGFFILLAINVGLAVAMLIMDPGYFDAAVHSGRIGTNLCAKANHLIPASWETVTTCRISNAVPFMIMPGIVLLYIVGRLLRGDFDGGARP